ncbi:MAG: DMT family transporter [Betaproteobacteria bacterium]
MGVFLALLAMACFAANIVLTRYAVARMPVESGFFIVLATNVLFPGLVYPFELAVRTAPWSWDWKGAGIFALGGIVGTFLGRRFLFDTVHLLGPARASVFHSTAPAFALVGAWLLADERLGWYEIGLMAVVWLGLWFTQPRAGTTQVTAAQARLGLIAGILTVAGFGFGNVLRGVATRTWEEIFLGTVIASVAALLCQVLVTRHWSRIGAQLRSADRKAIGLYLACGVTTSLGSVFISAAMLRMEIALATLVVHTTPLLIFPVSVFILKNREELTARTLAGAALVLAGIAALLLR